MIYSMVPFRVTMSDR